MGLCLRGVAPLLLRYLQSASRVAEWPRQYGQPAADCKRQRKYVTGGLVNDEARIVWAPQATRKNAAEGFGEGCGGVGLMGTVGAEQRPEHLRELGEDMKRYCKISEWSRRPLIIPHRPVSP